MKQESSEMGRGGVRGDEVGGGARKGCWVEKEELGSEEGRWGRTFGRVREEEVGCEKDVVRKNYVGCEEKT